MITTFILVGGCLEPVDLLTWAHWIAQPYNDHIRTDFVGEVRITTLFRGIELNPLGSPAFFECGVILNDAVIEIERTATLGEAERRHEAMVDRWRKGPAAIRPEPTVTDFLAVALASPCDFRYPESEEQS